MEYKKYNLYCFYPWMGSRKGSQYGKKLVPVKIEVSKRGIAVHLR